MADNARALITLDTLRTCMGEDALRHADITLRGFLESDAAFSGGAWNSAIEQLSRASPVP
ncbi:MAG: hypothetical protein ACOY9J_12605 [Pseudomonadota bacterium]